MGAAQPALAAQADACRPLDAPAEAFVLRMPFELVDGRVYVQAEVNGRGPFRFAIDTGASGIGCADMTLVDALGLKPQGRTGTSDGVQTAPVDTVRLDSLGLGGLAKQDVEAITRDLYAQVAQAPLEAAGAGTLTNTRIETWRGRVPGPVRIGEAGLAGVEVRVADRFPEMLVGAHVLQQYAVLIDQRAQRIALCAR